MVPQVSYLNNEAYKHSKLCDVRDSFKNENGQGFEFSSLKLCLLYYQGEEECECASGTNCRFCSKCVLTKGKQCSPDSLQKECCDSNGMFSTTNTQVTVMV